MHSSVLISFLLVVWRTAQIPNKKDLSYWAGVTKTGSALVDQLTTRYLKIAERGGTHA